MILLTNTARKMQIFHLTHAQAPKVRMEIAVAIPSKDGTGGFKRQVQRVPSSLSLAKGETSEPLPAWVAKCPDVAKAIKAQLVSVAEYVEKEAAEIAVASPAPVEVPSTETIETVVATRSRSRA